MNIKDRVDEVNNSLGLEVTAKELRAIVRHINNEAIEYFLEEFADEWYIESLVNDIRKGGL